MNFSINEMFNNAAIQIKGRRYPLKYSISAEIFLEENGISITTMSKNMLSQPKKTSLLLAFAGLPRKEFRDKISFEKFVYNLSDKDAQKIISQIDVLAQAYFKCLLGKIEKYEKKQDTQEPKDTVKKNLLQSLCKLPRKLVGLFRK